MNRLARTFLTAALLLGVDAAGQTQSATPAQTWTAAPGPWGVLRCTRIRLRPPPEVLERTPLPDASRWVFDGLGWPAIDALLREAPLSEAERALLSEPRWREGGVDGTPRGIRVPAEVRRALSAAARAQLYDLLAAFASNLLHALPFVLPDDAAIARAGLNPRLRAAMDELTFRRGNRRCLVDADLLPPLAADAAELQRLKRLLFTVPSVKVELDRASLLQRGEVAAYWGRPQGKSAARMLRLFERAPELPTVDLTHILPPLAQRVLNSYAGTVDSPLDANCHWLAFNFLEARPDPRFLSGAGPDLRREDEEWHQLQERYRRVAPPYTFGDLLGLFAESDGQAELVHLMVYIADDLVMTKNGTGETSPFVLMRLADVDQAYAWSTALALRGFRRREPSPPEGG